MNPVSQPGRVTARSVKSESPQHRLTCSRIAAAPTIFRYVSCWPAKGRGQIRSARADGMPSPPSWARRNKVISAASAGIGRLVAHGLALRDTMPSRSSGRRREPAERLGERRCVRQHSLEHTSSRGTRAARIPSMRVARRDGRPSADETRAACGRESSSRQDDTCTGRTSRPQACRKPRSRMVEVEGARKRDPRFPGTLRQA